MVVFKSFFFLWIWEMLRCYSGRDITYTCLYSLTYRTVLHMFSATGKISGLGAFQFVCYLWILSFINYKEKNTGLVREQLFVAATMQEISNN